MSYAVLDDVFRGMFQNILDDKSISMHVSSLLMVDSFEETIADEIELIFSLRSMIQAELRTKLSNDVQLLFRCLDFINEHRKNVSLRESVITGARFFYLNLLLEPRRSIVFDEWLRSP